jgi:hypothetical protein
VGPVSAVPLVPDTTVTANQQPSAGDRNRARAPRHPALLVQPCPEATGIPACADDVGLTVGPDPAAVLPDARQPAIASAEAATTTPTSRQDARPPIDPTLALPRTAQQTRIDSNGTEHCNSLSHHFASSGLTKRAEAPGSRQPPIRTASPELGDNNTTGQAGHTISGANMHADMRPPSRRYRQ